MQRNPWSCHRFGDVRNPHKALRNFQMIFLPFFSFFGFYSGGGSANANSPSFMRASKNAPLMSPMNTVMSAIFILAASIHTKISRTATSDAVAA